MIGFIYLLFFWGIFVDYYFCRLIWWRQNFGPKCLELSVNLFKTLLIGNKRVCKKANPSSKWARGLNSHVSKGSLKCNLVSQTSLQMPLCVKQMCTVLADTTNLIQEVSSYSSFSLFWAGIWKLNTMHWSSYNGISCIYVPVTPLVS